MNIALNELGVAVLSNAVLVVPLAVLVSMVGRFVKSPSLTWCLWGLVLVKFVTPAGYPVVPAPWFQAPGVTKDQEAPPRTEAPPLEGNDPHRGAHRSLIDPTVQSAEESQPLPAPGVATSQNTPLAVDASSIEDADSDSRPLSPRAAASSSVAQLASEASCGELTPPPPPLAVADDAHESLPLQSDTEDLSRFPVVERPPSTPAVSLTPASVLISVWASGALVLLTLTAIRVRRFHRLVRRAEPAPAQLSHRAGELADMLGLRTVPRVVITSGRVPPLLWGIGRRAVILLPRELLTQLDDQQRSALLAHELAHYARLDHWTRWFEQAVRSVWWWHPVAWWAGRRLREAEEQCCDAWVLRLLNDPDAPRRYADALLKTVDFLSAARPVPTVATGITPVRRSLRPFHRRLTMIVETRPRPNLSWPARMGLLVIAALVLPASIAAVGEEQPTLPGPPAPPGCQASAWEPTTGAASAARSGDAGATNATLADLAKQKLRGPGVPKQKLGNEGQSPRLEAGRTKIIADEQTNSIIVSGTKYKLAAVEKIVEAADGTEEAAKEIDKPRDQPEVGVRRAGETITVVRATYALPEPVAKSLHELIQRHGQRFKFLTSVEPSPEQSEFLNSMMEGRFGRGMSSYGGVDEGHGGEYVPRGSPRSGIGRSAAIRGTPSNLTRLTIIATPEIQQQFGEFLKALNWPAVPEAENESRKAIGEAQTLTLVRANYKFESLRGIQDVDLKTLMALDRGETEDMLGRGFARTGDLRDNSMGFSVLKLLKALKQSNLVPLLLVSADTDGLTVTTTEEFQQALGKFIRFLQEHEPPAERGRSQPSPEESAGHSGDQLKAYAILQLARRALKAGKLEQARELAEAAAKLRVTYELFSDRPELVLKDIEQAEAARGDEIPPEFRSKTQPARPNAEVPPEFRRKSGAGTGGGRTEQSSAAQHLDALKRQERELQALLKASEEGIQNGVDREALLLVIRQLYSPTVESGDLMHEYNELTGTESKLQEMKGRFQDDAPQLKDLRERITELRESMGLPTGDDAKPVDQLDFYLQRIKQQVQTTRSMIKVLENVVEALETGEQQSSKQPPSKD